MKANKVLDQLFFINYQLQLADADQFFIKIGFLPTAKEETIRSYMGANSNDLNGINWFALNLQDGKIMNSNFKTSMSISTEYLTGYAETKYGFIFQKMEDGIAIYKRDQLSLHVHTIESQLLQLGKLTFALYLFETPKSEVQIITIKPPLSA